MLGALETHVRRGTHRAGEVALRLGFPRRINGSFPQLSWFPQCPLLRLLTGSELHQNVEAEGSTHVRWPSSPMSARRTQRHREGDFLLVALLVGCLVLSMNYHLLRSYTECPIEHSPISWVWAVVLFFFFFGLFLSLL